MDKNTVIGLVLIMAVIFGFSWLNKPSKEEAAQMQHRRDSIAMVNENNRLLELERVRLQEINDSIALAETGSSVDSVRAKSQFGDFAAAAVGVEEFVEVNTEKLNLTFSTKGGQINIAELVGYQRYDSMPLQLCAGDESTLGYTLLTSNNRIIDTRQLYFTPELVKNDSSTVLTMSAQLDSISSFDFVYTIPNNDFMVRKEIRANNIASYLAPNLNSLDIEWESLIRQNERGRKFESRYATLNYKYAADDMEKLSESKNDAESLTGKVSWVAFKDHFFSSIMIADQSFTSAKVESEIMPENSPYIKRDKMSAVVAFDPTGKEPTVLHSYYGPNQYKVLKSYDNDCVISSEKLKLQQIIPLGWSLFRWISTYAIIPMFNFFGRFISNYGIIILLMTIIIKLVILPFTYKSYISTAKMRVLKPQIDEINARIPADKAMERQQATMALYSRVGVSPMSGCLPMLFQMPILFAMFSFFPTAFELRGQSFLWADDLSSYDAIISWNAYIPLITPFFGNHISLFCLLMTITNIIYTKINMASQAGNEQMAAMKWMMYLMPVMFMFMFNNYASGLSYYYFISLLITIAQTYLFRLFIDENKLLAQLEAKKSKPKKKSGFMQRLEAAQREQQKTMLEQQKKRK